MQWTDDTTLPSRGRVGGMTGWGPKPVVLWSSTRFPFPKPDICALRSITPKRPPRPMSNPQALEQARGDLGIRTTCFIKATENSLECRCVFRGCPIMEKENCVAPYLFVYCHRRNPSGESLAEKRQRFIRWVIFPFPLKLIEGFSCLCRTCRLKIKRLCICRHSEDQGCNDNA